MPETIAPTQINHLGIAVRNLEEALMIWRDGLGLTVERIVHLPERGLHIAFLPCGQTTIELVAPAREDSEISKFLAERGPGIHHVCLQYTDIAQAGRQAQDRGLRLLGQGPQLGAEGLPVRFAHPKSTAGALVEMLEKADA